MLRRKWYNNFLKIKYINLFIDRLKVIEDFKDFVIYLCSSL